MSKSKKPQPKNKKTTPTKKFSPKLPSWLTSGRKKQKLIITLSIIFLTLFYFLILRDLPSPKTLQRDIYPISTKILDRNGELLYEIYADENRTPIKLADLPDYVKLATISIEDKNFYSHHGFDTGGIIRAAWKTITGQRLEGGSTITQQLVKVALLTPERTVIRKIREAFLAVATETLYSKDEILEMYLNHIPYGGTSYGIEAASRKFFDKSAHDLTLEESALLVGLPQAPSRYSPFRSPDTAKNRQAQVLSRMVEENHITEEEALRAKNTELIYASSETDIKAPHFVMYVRELLEETYGVTTLEQGGLQVTTPLDLALHEDAQASLSAEISSLERFKVSNGAALITNPSTGEILSMIGSRDYFDSEIDGKVNVTTRLRQPGSSIKPLNYALGIETGTITPSTMLIDSPICFTLIGQPTYCPKNYDNSFRGPTQIRFALGNSYNIPAVKVLALNGLENFVNFATKMGITTWDNPDNYGLSLTLGGGEVMMTDLASAFAVFANSGTKVALQPILKVETSQGKILEQYNPSGKSVYVETSRDLLPSVDHPEKVLSPGTAFLISHILHDNNARADSFGTSSVLNVRGKTVSVKTGTTNNLRDNWTIGYTRDRLVSVWVGNNDNTPMSYVASGITGASPIWQDLMKLALVDIETPGPYQPTEGVEGATVCTHSGAVPAADNPCETRYEYFLTDSVSTIQTVEKRQIFVNRDTHHPPNSEEEFGNIEEQEHLVGTDPFVKDYCLDCDPYPEGYEEPPLTIPYIDLTNLDEDI